MKEPAKPEIDERTLKLLVGGIALTLGTLTDLFAGDPLKSISAAYHEGGTSESIFVGFLFAIAAFLFAYNGRWRSEMVLSKLAAVAALLVALFPCGCESAPTVPFVHYGAAALMFLVLAYFCYVFHKRAHEKHYREADRRAVVYAICGAVIVAAIVLLAMNGIMHWDEKIPRLVFYGEHAALVAFGISWLTAAKILPVLSRSDERLNLF
jgi:hypothetical protein